MLDKEQLMNDLYQESFESRDFSYLEQTFTSSDGQGNGVEWRVVDLLAHAKSIDVTSVRVDKFEGYLAHISKSYTKDDWTRVHQANLKYPILIGSGEFVFSDDGLGRSYPYIFDGVHRLVKAWKSGVAYIDARVLSTLPKPVVVGKGRTLNGMRYV